MGLANAAEIEGNNTRIAVGGESAGGNLAAVVLQMARDNKIATPIHQLLIYPVTDMVNGPTSKSTLENADAKPLSRAMLTWFYDYYIPEVSDRAHPYASPSYASSLAGLLAIFL
jgi:acetyl esterase